MKHLEILKKEKGHNYIMDPRAFSIIILPVDIGLGLLQLCF